MIYLYYQMKGKVLIMTVKELKEILKNFNDDENVIGEIAMTSCGGHGIYNKTSSACLVSITSKEREKVKELKRSIKLWSEAITEKDAQKKYNINSVKCYIEKDKKELKKLLDKIK